MATTTSAGNPRDSSSGSTSALLPRRTVIYCGACGLPPEYCEFLDPSFLASQCDPWLRKYHPDLHEKLAPQRQARIAADAASAGGGVGYASSSAPSVSEAKKKEKPPKPDKPWTTEERLVAFYNKYVPEKVADVPGLVEKYRGKEEKLFDALVKKYGDEPHDPYYSESEKEDEDDDDEEKATGAGACTGTGGGADPVVTVAHAATASHRKVVPGPKKAKADGTSAGAPRVVIRKVAQKKKRNLTVVAGMETVPGLKLKDASKAFSKRFAGSSSVKDGGEKGGGGGGGSAGGGQQQEIILQGDHMYDVAEMIVDKFGVPESCVWLDIDGEIVPLR
jgi:translation initiation factor 1 (eIF-1/SUI1)